MGYVGVYSCQKKIDGYKIYLSKHSTQVSVACQNAKKSKGRKRDASAVAERKQQPISACVPMKTDQNCFWKQLMYYLEAWLVKDEKTNPEFAYWIPKYIMVRGTKAFWTWDLFMSHQMRRLSKKPMHNRLEGFYGKKDS